MAKDDETSADSSLTTDTLLLGMLTLMIDDRERAVRSDPGQPKTEILLASAGLTYQQIAAMMNKSPDAVRMMLARLRKGSAGKKPKIDKEAL